MKSSPSHRRQAVGGTSGYSVTSQWGAVPGECVPHGPGASRSSGSCSAPHTQLPQLPTPTFPHTPPVHAPVTNLPSLFHLLRIHFPPTQPCPCTPVLCSPNSCLSSGSSSSRKSSLISQVRCSLCITLAGHSLCASGSPSSHVLPQDGSWSSFTPASPTQSMSC